MREFVEKPAPDQIDTNNISAGAYVLERSVLELLKRGERASIERDVFPRLVGDGLYGHVGSGYWMDIGTPERYLEATFDILEGTVKTEVAERLSGFVCVEDGVDNDGRIVPAALVESGCRIAAGAHIGGRAVLQHDVERRRGHHDRERGRDARGVDRRQLHAARLHRGRGRADRRSLRDRRDERDRRGRRRSAPTTSCPTARGCFPGVSLPDGALRF